MPRVITWFRVYCVALTALYLLMTVAGVVFVFLPSEWFEGEDEIEPVVMGILITVLSLPFAAAFAAGIFLPPRPWVWIYDLVLIAIGFGSCCILPASIALLVFWIKPETKAYFNRI